jgi:mannonate dehydratase
MKLGLGLYRDILTTDNFKFTRQTGATHVVVHLVRYFQGDNPSLSRGDDTTGWGISKDDDDVWSYESLVRLKKEIESHGLTWEAIENFNPAHWHDVLLNGPKKQKQLDYLKQIIRNVGKAGIPVIGYNFSIAGVWGWTKGPVGRGEAVSVKFNADEIDLQKPIPKGMVWNMAYNAKKKTND